MGGRHHTFGLYWSVSVICVVIGLASGCGHGSHYERALTDIGLSVESRLIQRINVATDLVTDAPSEFEAATGSLSVAEGARASGRAAAIDLADDAFFRCASFTFELERVIASIEDVGNPWSRQTAHDAGSLSDSYMTMKNAFRNTHVAMQSWVRAYEHRLNQTRRSGDSSGSHEATLPTSDTVSACEEAASRAHSFRDELRETGGS